MCVSEIVGEGLRIHKMGTPAEQEAAIIAALKEVGLDPDSRHRYPHEFSGGQRQRIAIARALITRPRLIVADEPVSALDVSVQAQVLNLMQDLQAQFDVTYLLISHDLAVVDHLCADVAVIFQGRIVEQGAPQTLFRHAAHPYTQALLDAVPRMEPRRSGDPRRRTQQVEPRVQLPAACPYAHRCPRAQGICDSQRPELTPLAEAGHRVACHFPQTHAATETGHGPGSHAKA
jgi:peptide/nickel transport system ATP-binding protein